MRVSFVVSSGDAGIPEHPQTARPDQSRHRGARATAGTRGLSVGHAGTLDPFASGVLVVCLGGACRLSGLAMGQDKTYVTTIRLGVPATPTIAPARSPRRPTPRQRRQSDSPRLSGSSSAKFSRSHPPLGRLGGRTPGLRSPRGQGCGPCRPDSPNRPHRHSRLRLAAFEAPGALRQRHVHPVDCPQHRLAAGRRGLLHRTGPHRQRRVHARPRSPPRASCSTAT